MTDNPDFGTFGCYHETPVSQMSAGMKDVYDFTVSVRV